MYLFKSENSKCNHYVTVISPRLIRKAIIIIKANIIIIYEQIDVCMYIYTYTYTYIYKHTNTYTYCFIPLTPTTLSRTCTHILAPVSTILTPFTKKPKLIPSSCHCHKSRTRRGTCVVGVQDSLKIRCLYRILSTYTYALCVVSVVCVWWYQVSITCRRIIACAAVWACRLVQFKVWLLCTFVTHCDVLAWFWDHNNSILWHKNLNPLDPKASISLESSFGIRRIEILWHKNLDPALGVPCYKLIVVHSAKIFIPSMELHIFENFDSKMVVVPSRLWLPLFHPRLSGAVLAQGPWTQCYKLAPQPAVPNRFRKETHVSWIPKIPSCWHQKLDPSGHARFDPTWHKKSHPSDPKILSLRHKELGHVCITCMTWDWSKYPSDREILCRTE